MKTEVTCSLWLWGFWSFNYFKS